VKDIESAVAQHYESGDLLDRILKGLAAAGANMAQLGPEDLAPVDEFHLGGRNATAYALSKMSLRADHHVLDVGCGIGGATRHIAQHVGCKVTGIDLTPEYISTAKTLAKMTGQDDQVSYEVASALAMPYDDETFDAAITLHVAMNIADRATLYGEIARVVKAGATLCVYDVMKKGDEALSFPVPWAETPETSHLTTPEEMRALLDDAGFTVHDVDDRTEFAREFFRQTLAAAADGPPPLGVHILLGSNAREKIGNTIENLESGRIAPVQMIARLN